MDRPVFALAALNTVLLLSACGGGTVTSSTGTTTNNPSPPPTTPSAEWAWISGSNYASSTGLGPAGIYGTLGTASASNVPGGRGATTGWADSSGNFWIFGGSGLDATATFGDLNDVWKFDPKNNQ